MILLPMLLATSFVAQASFFSGDVAFSSPPDVRSVELRASSTGTEILVRMARAPGVEQSLRRAKFEQVSAREYRRTSQPFSFAPRQVETFDLTGSVTEYKLTTGVLGSGPRKVALKLPRVRLGFLSATLGPIFLSDRGKATALISAQPGFAAYPKNELSDKLDLGMFTRSLPGHIAMVGGASDLSWYFPFALFSADYAAIFVVVNPYTAGPGGTGDDARIRRSGRPGSPILVQEKSE